MRRKTKEERYVFVYHGTVVVFLLFLLLFWMVLLIGLCVFEEQASGKPWVYAGAVSPFVRKRGDHDADRIHAVPA